VVGEVVTINAITLLLVEAVVSRTVAEDCEALQSTEMGLAVGFSNQA
jgi:hypothetical protein